jgi:hypothetical protein
MSHNLVVVACCKNEAAFIKEWVEYHLIVGVEHFYIYDAATDDTHAVLEPYISKGLVTYIEWKVFPAQVSAYHNFVFARRGMDANWAAFIDLDEYIVPISDRLLDILATYDRPEVAGLAIGWTMFGSNGHVIRPQGLITENYTRTINYTKHPERYTKGIVRPFRVNYVDDPHIFRPKSRTKMVREDMKEIKFGQHWHRVGDFPVNKLTINHYFCKSFSDFQGKIARRGPDGGGRNLQEFAIFNSIGNEVEDLRIQKFVPELRRRMYEEKRKDIPVL